MQPIGKIQQVGGTHYGTKFGHWDYCKLANTPYLEGHATKYLFRWRNKNGVQDLQKSLTFVQKLLVGKERGVTNPDQNAQGYAEALAELFDQNNVPSAERLLMQAIFTWEYPADLEWVEQELLLFIQEQQAAEPTQRYTNQG